MAKNNHAAVVGALKTLLADNYLLYLKTQNYHWNVTGPYFGQLHAMFQTQYEELTVANDEIAERIRALGEKAPGSFTEFAKLAHIKEETGAPDAMQMIKTLAKDHETLVKSALAVVEAGEEEGDVVSVDLATTRADVHQKTVWMLKAHLD